MSVRMDVIPSSVEQIYILHDISCKHGKNIENTTSLYLCPNIQYNPTWLLGLRIEIITLFLC